MRAVAFIPARHGSKRVPGKNVRVLHGHPMLAYTIAPALESGVFDSVIVSTDSEEIAAIAKHYGAEVPFLRPSKFAGDTSPDIEWLEYTLAELRRRLRVDCSLVTIHRALVKLGMSYKKSRSARASKKSTTSCDCVPR